MGSQAPTLLLPPPRPCESFPGLPGKKKEQRLVTDPSQTVPYLPVPPALCCRTSRCPPKQEAPGGWVAFSDSPGTARDQSPQGGPAVPPGWPGRWLSFTLENKMKQLYLCPELEHNGPLSRALPWKSMEKIHWKSNTPPPPPK